MNSPKDSRILGYLQVAGQKSNPGACSDRKALVGKVCVMGKTGGKRKKKVETVFLVCEETGDYNYTLRRKTGGEKLKLSKFCPRLRKHTTHVEKKK